MTAAKSFADRRVSKLGAYLPSLESAYTVGHVVVSDVLTHWPQYSQAVAGVKLHFGIQYILSLICIQ